VFVIGVGLVPADRCDSQVTSGDDYGGFSMDRNIMLRRLGVFASSAVLATGLVLASGASAFAAPGGNGSSGLNGGNGTNGGNSTTSGGPGGSHAASPGEVGGVGGANPVNLASLASPTVAEELGALAARAGPGATDPDSRSRPIHSSIRSQLHVKGFSS
jgi:hypothetical protein